MKAHMFAHDHVFADHQRTASADKGIRISRRIRAYLNAKTQCGRWRTYHGGVRTESHVIAQDNAVPHKAVNGNTAFQRYSPAKVDERSASQVYAVSHEQEHKPPLQYQRPEKSAKQPHHPPQQH